MAIPHSSTRYPRITMKKFDLTFLKVAYLFAEHSKCTRLQTGAVIVIDGRSRATGYNGLPPGSDDSLVEHECPDCSGFGPYDTSITRDICPTCQDHGVLTNPEVQHAERNALDNCTKHGISTNGATLYVTHAPCLECAKSIVATGIKRVVYNRPYRLTTGLDYLATHNIQVEMLDLPV